MAFYTKLDIVNRGLRLLGQLAVNDIDTPHPAVPTILDALDYANRTVQSRKWWFNHERTTLHPQVSDQRIVIPNDAASVDAYDQRLKVSQRGRWLYDNQRGLYTFSAPVEVLLHRVLAFEDLPPTAAHYVATQAMIKVHAEVDGDSLRELAEEAREALNALTAEDTRNTAANLLQWLGVRTAMHRINQRTPFNYRR